MEIGKIRLLIVNDVYAVEPINKLGGYAELSTLVSKYRTENSLFFLNGDFLGGSAFASHFEGENIIEILNAMGLDGCVIGNHEFDYGPDALCKRISEAKFPCLGANIKSKITNELLGQSKEYEIFSFKFPNPFFTPSSPLPSAPATSDDLPVDNEEEIEVKLGVFGICTLYTPNLSFPGPNVLFEPIVEKSKEMIDILQSKSDVIIAQTHVSMKEDIQIANETKGISVIIGGHDHKPFAQTENDVLIFKCGQNAYWLGIVDLLIEIDEVKEIKCFPSWQMIPNRGCSPDPAITDIIYKYRKLKEEADRLIDMEELIATVRNDQLISLSETVRTKPNQFANLIADAMLHYHLFDGVKADFAIINGGVIRGDKVYPPNTKITRRILLEELPFPLKTTMIEIEGRSIKNALEQHLIAYPNSSGSYPHLSKNMKMEFKRTAKYPNRITSLKLNGEELDMDKRYKIVTTSFLAGGGDNISSYKENSRMLGDEQKWIDHVLSYFKFLGELDATLNLRVIPIS